MGRSSLFTSQVGEDDWHLGLEGQEERNFTHKICAAAVAAVWHIALLLPSVLIIWENTDKASSSLLFSTTHMLLNGANSTGERQGEILAYTHHELAWKGWPLVTESSWNTNLDLLLTAGSKDQSPKLILQILPDPLQCRASCEHYLRQSRVQPAPQATAELQLYRQHPVYTWKICSQTASTMVLGITNTFPSGL